MGFDTLLNVSTRMFFTLTVWKGEGPAICEPDLLSTEKSSPPPDGRSCPSLEVQISDLATFSGSPTPGSCEFR